MPFGLAMAPRTFQRALCQIFVDEANVIMYLDDLLVHTHDEQLHIQVLEKVFEKLAKNQILLNLEKCAFMKREVRFLGNLIKGNEIRPFTREPV